MRTLLLLAALASAHGAPRWELRYFYDQDRSRLSFADICIPSARRGIAVGSIAEEGKNPRGVAAVTNDGGRNWSLVPLKDTPQSLFCLNDTVCWVVTRKGMYKTVEGGRSWKKVSAPKDALRVHFLDENRGFAVGLKKSLWETRDGGKRWTRVPAAAEPKAKEEYTVYSNVVFVTKDVGMVTGWHQAPRRGDSEALPSWVDPERAARRKEWPAMSIILETHDGGGTWTFSTSSLFGRITRVRFDPKRGSVALVEFGENFPYPAEVYHWNWRGGKTERVLRRKDRAVTDIYLAPNGPVYLAATAVKGMLHLPVPGPLKILRSDDLSAWHEMEVDYRATARRAAFGASGKNIWVATDTGMLLNLVE